jgi:hypothetical protein
VVWGLALAASKLTEEAPASGNKAVQRSDVRSRASLRFDCGLNKDSLLSLELQFPPRSVKP